MPDRRKLQRELEKDMEGLPTRDIHKHPGTKFVTFAHLLSLLWAPLQEYMDACGSESAPAWTTQLAMHHSLVLKEMEGAVPSADEQLEIDTWLEYLQTTLNQFLKVHVPRRLLLHVMGHVVPFHVAPTRANGLHLLLSGACSKLLGPAMATQAKRMILADIADVPVRLIPNEDLAIRVGQDLINAFDNELEEEDDERQPTKKSRTTKAIDETMRTKTLQAVYMLRNRLAAYRVSDTVEGAVELLHGVSGSEPVNNALAELVTDQPLRKHLLLLDGAIDRATSERLLSAREAGTLAGVSLATDESPPSQPRFRGLRFQITVLYAGAFKDLREWSTCETPPITKTSILADIAHCPGKKGVDVSKVIEMQLNRVGLSAYDVVSGTGDGGGENEGHHGIHAYFENMNPGL